MTTTEDDLRPAEFAQAAAGAITDAQGRGFRDAARILADAGLSGVCASEAAGGLGLGIDFAVPLVAEAGKLQLQWPLPETILVARALGDSPLAAELASGRRVATWALQGSLPEGFAGHARHAAECDWVLVADGRGGGALLDIGSLTLNHDEALDPEHPQSWLELEPGKVRKLADIDAAAFAMLQREGHLLVASLVNGAAEAALATTAAYMATRVQFGRPLSSKQAVRHLLARMHLLQEAASASVERALALDEYGHARQTGTVLAGALANAAFVLEKSIHLHGGMGFTWELPLHYSLREIRKFDAAFGAGALARQAGLRFIASVQKTTETT
ncbi:MAG: acyl-CoA dehydrogenase family protein [Pseudomonadota bacterium]